MSPRQSKEPSAKSVAEAKPIAEDTSISIGESTTVKDVELKDGSVLIEVIHRDDNSFIESMVAAPKSYSKIGGVSYRGGAYWNRKSINATEDTILEAMINEGMISTPIEKRVKKILEKKFKVVPVKHVDSDIHQEVMQFFDEHSLWLKLGQCIMNAELFGAGYLWYQYADIKGLTGLSKPVRQGKVELLDIQMINALAFRETKRLPNNDPEYYIFNSKENNVRVELTIHPSRIIPVINDPMGTHPDGVASLLKTISHVDDLRSIIWMMRQLLLRRGAPITIIYIPTGYPESAKATMRQSFKQAQPNDIITIPFDPNVPKDQQIRVEWNPSFSSIGNL
ncbi:MAG: hypothetical protein V1769_03710, partial [Thermoplasmatota archaeon]